MPERTPVETNELSKRYRCLHCGFQLLCIGPGSGRFTCHGEPMEIMQPKELPASD